MRSSARILFNLVDVTAKSDGNYVSNSTYEHTNLANLDNNNNYLTKKYATCEQNMFLLDGSFELMDAPESDEFSFWSAIVSNDNGLFNTNPTITRQFSENHSSSGITLSFDENYPLPLLVRISLYDFQNSLLNTKDIEPDKYYNYFIDMKTSNYRKLIIEFIGVEPCQRARLKTIIYGQILEYSDRADKNLSSAEILECADMYSIEAPICTSAIKIIDTDELFNITNPEGLYSMLQERQKIEVYEKVSDESSERLMAVHYVKEWRTENGTTSTFNCQDILGVMDGGAFKGNLYDSVPAGDIIDEIMSGFGWSDYEINEQLASIELSGVIKPCTYREALQQVMFAISGSINTTRGEKIQLVKVSKNKQTTIPNEREFLNPQYLITQTDLISGVEVVAHHYKKDTELSEAYSATLGGGQYEVQFNYPYDKDDLRATNCTIIESGYFYAIINVPTSSEVIIEGYKYTDYTSLYSVQNTNLPSGAKPRVNQVSEATLVSRSNARTVARNLYEYYQYRLLHSLSIICLDEKVGTFNQIQTPSGDMTSILINTMRISLTKGFTADVEGLGYALRTMDYLFTGVELITGEEMGVI